VQEGETGRGPRREKADVRREAPEGGGAGCKYYSWIKKKKQNSFSSHFPKIIVHLPGAFVRGGLLRLLRIILLPVVGASPIEKSTFVRSGTTHQVHNGFCVVGIP